MVANYDEVRLVFDRYLNTSFKEQMRTKGKSTYYHVMDSSLNVHVQRTLITHNQKEADTLLLLHALTIDRDAEVVIDSPDTYVFLLMVQMCPSLPVATSFLTGKGKMKKKFAMQPIYDMLGPKRASTMLGFHACTGSDIYGRFASRTKEWCFEVFMSCDDEILEALASLGNIDPETCTQLERFVCFTGPKYAPK